MTKIGSKLKAKREKEAKDKILLDKILAGVEKVSVMKTPTNYQEYKNCVVTLKREKITVSKSGAGYLEGIVVVTATILGNSMNLEIRNTGMAKELVIEFLKDRQKVLDKDITKEIIEKYFN